MYFMQEHFFYTPMFERFKVLEAQFGSPSPAQLNRNH